ncbi:MAG: hypothetical protein ACI9R3_005359, partial [Verrucomicrobiales bacterium]
MSASTKKRKIDVRSFVNEGGDLKAAMKTGTHIKGDYQD